MSLHIPFDNSYARLPAQLYAPQRPTAVSAPKLIAYNDALAADLGFSHTADASDLAEIFAGNALPEGAEPIAQLYAGHQFGNWNPQLGDGRAVLLGEVAPLQGRFDIQLKGSGPTPFSRRGDGRAWLGPVLREYVVSEAMHALGVPTTRALAAVETGETVMRETALPGAVLTRVASSHIRVGTFQVLAARGDTEGLRALFEHARDRHAPDAETPLDFLQAVIARQAALIAQWMSFGFIHGVMNTDNTAVSGETIDYGPCAFMDHFNPSMVFSSIDQMGRYAYSNQPDVIVWNMAMLANALLGLTSDPEGAVPDFSKAVHDMPDLLRAHWLRRFAAKIGISVPNESDGPLVSEFLELMAQDKADFTNCFRALSEGRAMDHFLDREAYDNWATRWEDRLKHEADPNAVMRAANPAFIARNHRVEEMINAAVSGDYAPFHRLNSVLANPFDDQPDAADLARPPSDDERVQRTFCGT